MMDYIQETPQSPLKLSKMIPLCKTNCLDTFELSKSIKEDLSATNLISQSEDIRLQMTHHSNRSKTFIL